MKSTISMVLGVSLCFGWAFSCSSLDESPDLSKISLPIGVSVLEGDSIQEINDVDGDGAKDRFAFCKLDTTDNGPIGFVIGLTTKGNYLLCEWPEASVNNETRLSFEQKDKDLTLFLQNFYVNNTLVLAYSEEAQTMVFKENLWSHRTTDNIFSFWGFRLVGGEYHLAPSPTDDSVKFKSLPPTVIHNTPLTIEQDSLFFSLMN
jgi:hypothetical protein